MRNFLKHFFKDESGMGVVEVILIIVVLIGLVIIFQTQIKKVVDSNFKTITSKTEQVNVGAFSYKRKLSERACGYVSYLCDGPKISQEDRN